jgi:DNA-binding transcriptional LysR family regulator
VQPIVYSGRANSLGSRVLEQARDLLQRTEALKSLTPSDAEPHSLLRIGLAHALAEGTLIEEPIQALTEKYPKVRLRLSSELTGELIHRLLAGELDVAAVLLPEGKTAPAPLLTNIIASDRMEIVQGAAGNLDGDWKSLGGNTTSRYSDEWTCVGLTPFLNVKYIEEGPLAGSVSATAI